MNLNRKQFKTEFNNQPIELEFSDLAGQATSAVIGRHGETEVLVTVVMSDLEKNVDYFPLVVDYEERFYAAGKILGSRFIRREGRPSEEAILSGRLIDRTIRPLFDHRLRREVQVVVTILQIDKEHDPEFITLLAASAALGVSEIPWNGPVAGVRLYFDGAQLKIGPTNSDFKSGGWPKNEKGFTAFVAGTADRINMIELEGIDAEEPQVAGAFDEAQKEIAGFIQWQNKIIKEVGKQKAKINLSEVDSELVKKVKQFLKDKLEAVVYTKNKQDRETGFVNLKEELKASFSADNLSDKEIVVCGHLFDDEVDALVHRNIIEKDKRPDARALDEVRDLYAEVGLLKRAHGSAIFIRGNTQALAITTIAPPGAEQLIETMEFSGKRRFLLHYNFPPYSVGEIGRMGAPGRREIGHGSLAEKAVRNLIPPQEEFPYTVRVVSEILSSNGSSSMATACGASLSLMDAGVPIKKAVAGIAMGLMTDQSKSKLQTPNYKILTDIQGPEDHHGDMDLKVAGSKDGVRAIQMDVKIDGLTNKMLEEALAQAKKARLEILKAMDKAIAEPRKELSPYAPLVLSLAIRPDQIGEVIGPGGKVINGIIERTGALSIDIEEDGKVFIAGDTREIAERALHEVEAIVKEYQVGDIVEGTVVKILEFGAIVEFGPGRDGMIHISELKEGYVKKVEDVLKVGDFVRAKIVKAEGGKIGLSLKALRSG